MVLSDWFKRFAAILAIFAILRFINNRWLHHFYRMPCVGWDNATMITCGRVKKNALRLVATFVKDYFIEFTTQNKYIFIAVRVSVNGNNRSGQQRIQYALRMIV